MLSPWTYASKAKLSELGAHEGLTPSQALARYSSHGLGEVDVNNQIQGYQQQAAQQQAAAEQAQRDQANLPPSSWLENFIAIIKQLFATRQQQQDPTAGWTPSDYHNYYSGDSYLNTRQ